MAILTGVLHTSHGPLTTMEPDAWEKWSTGRSYRPDVPAEALDDRQAKAGRARAALEVLRQRLAEMKPDVLVIFGEVEAEEVYPAMSVYVGPSFVGRTNYREDQVTVPGQPELANAILLGLRERGFDPAFQFEQLNDSQMCHAVMRPLDLFSAHSIPTVPVFLNGYYAPQTSAVRCYQVGRAVREVIDSYPSNLRITVVGSGGLWHTPVQPGSYLDEAFDTTELDYLARGDIRGMAEYFDSYKIPPDDTSQDVSKQVRKGIVPMTGLASPSGPQMGTREICNWIGAAAVADGRPNVIVDYIPMYASPIGTAFAYCDDI